MTRRGRAPDPDELQVEKVGLGYVGTLVSQGVAMSIDRLVHVRGELVGELTVERAPEGHVFIGRFSLSNVDVRRRTAQYLAERTNNLDWKDALETFCLRVLRTEREGMPFEQLGGAPSGEEVRYMLWPLLVADRPTLIFGEGGVGKSTLATGAAVMVASGQQVIPGFRVDVSGPVLVVDWEADRDEWNSLVAAVSNGVGIKPPKEIYYRAGTGPLTDQLDEIAQHVTQHGVQLLIVDSVGLAMPSRSEGSDANEGALRLFSALRHLGVTTLLIDHVAGADMGVERAVAKPYGSVYKFNLARNIFELRAQAPTPDGTLHLGLFHRKSNRTAKLNPMGLAIYHGPGELLFQREELEAAEANAAIPLHSRIHTLLLAGGKTARQIADAVNSAPKTVDTTLRRMQAMGMVTKLPQKVGRHDVWAAVYNGSGGEVQREVQREVQHVGVTNEGAAEQADVADEPRDDPWG